MRTIDFLHDTSASLRCERKPGFAGCFKANAFMIRFENSLDFARRCDAADPLRPPCARILFSRLRRPAGGVLHRQFLGLQPRATQDYLVDELEDWANLGVEGHFHARHPWFRYQDFLTEQLAQLLGAKPVEVVSMGSLTTNLPPPLRLVLPSHRDALQDHGGVRRLSVRPLRGRDAGATTASIPPRRW